MEKKDKGGSFEWVTRLNEYFCSEETLAVTLLDLWFAGQETTATTLYWALAYLVLHPQFYKQLQEELDSVTGQNRPVNLSDKTATPFLNAVILEVLRVSKLVPMNIWRATKEDTVVGSYVIPKGTAIASQISLIMSEKENFKEPEKVSINIWSLSSFSSIHLVFWRITTTNSTSFRLDWGKELVWESHWPEQNCTWSVPSVANRPNVSDSRQLCFEL